MSTFFSYRDNDMYVHHTQDPTPDPTVFQMHAHESMEMYYYISGEGKYIVEGNYYDIHPHDILIFRSGEMHKLEITESEPYERLTIHFTPSLFSSIDSSGVLMLPFVERLPGQHNLYAASPENIKDREFIYKDFDSFHGTRNEVRLHILSRLFSLLIDISDEYQTKILRPVQPLESVSYKITAYINKHLFEDISLGSISNEFYISKSQANRVFREATGYTIWNYIVIKRLLAAREKILNDEPAGKVYLECGFKDYSSFYRAYKAHFGSSPTNDSPLPLEHCIV